MHPIAILTGMKVASSTLFVKKYLQKCRVFSQKSAKDCSSSCGKSLKLSQKRDNFSSVYPNPAQHAIPCTPPMHGTTGHCDFFLLFASMQPYEITWFQAWNCKKP